MAVQVPTHRPAFRHEELTRDVSTRDDVLWTGLVLSPDEAVTLAFDDDTVIERAAPMAGIY
ncbi:hypothetical protein sos41_31650 [Alphaproteobacteria bacterium SO-S41]|nr:hypothetical protein sos41_31650 [Alphaproteobacteria bacterium SO-S41]